MGWTKKGNLKGPKGDKGEAAAGGKPVLLWSGNWSRGSVPLGKSIADKMAGYNLCAVVAQHTKVPTMHYIQILIQNEKYHDYDKGYWTGTYEYLATEEEHYTKHSSLMIRWHLDASGNLGPSEFARGDFAIAQYYLANPQGDASFIGGTAPSVIEIWGLM